MAIRHAKVGSPQQSLTNERSGARGNDPWSKRVSQVAASACKASPGPS